MFNLAENSCLSAFGIAENSQILICSEKEGLRTCNLELDGDET